VLAPLGLARAGGGEIGGQPGVLWRPTGRRWPQFCVQPPFNGLPATWGNDSMTLLAQEACQAGTV